MNTKTCTKCEESFPATPNYFFKHGIKADGTTKLYSQCKKCKTASTRLWEKTTPAGRLCKKRCKKRWEKTPAGRAYKKRERQRYKQKPYVKIRRTCAKRLKRFLNANNLQKNCSSSKYFDFTPKQLQEHLESQFTPNMTWNNYGTYWHIDHIVPLAYYGIESSDDPKIKEAWSLKNLQPLEASKNIKKGSFYEGKQHFYKK